jgi:hypothetical protein
MLVRVISGAEKLSLGAASSEAAQLPGRELVAEPGAGSRRSCARAVVSLKS